MDFVTHLTAQGLAERSVREYDKQARRYERWCWARQANPGTPTPVDLAGYAETVPNTWSSRKAIKAMLRHYLTWAGGDIYAIEAVRVPRKPRPHNRALSKDDARLLRDAATMVGGRQGLATLCGLYLAARRAEIAGLRWDGWTGDTFRWWRTKTSDWLEVPVHPALAEALGRAKPRDLHSQYLFPGDRGRPFVTPQTVWHWIGQVGSACGVEVTPHQLRHTALSTAYDATRDLRAVQDLAGHRDPATTSIYTRTTRARLEAAVESLDY